MSLHKKLILLALITAMPLLAQPPGLGSQTFHIGYDTDRNSATGCNWTRADGSTVSGIDLLMTVEVDAVGTPTVTSVSSSQCEGSTFASPVVVGGGWPVGLNVGTSGGDVIEAFLPLGLLGQTGAMDLYLDGESSMAGVDIMPDLGAQTIVYTFPAEIPTLSQWGVFVFCGLFLLAGILVLRRRKRLGRAGLIGFLGLLLIGAALMPFNADGEIDDWNGFSPLATDSAGDSPDEATDLLALFAANDEDRLYIRLDVTDSENDPPVAADDAAATLEDQAVNIDVLVNDSDPDGDTFAVTAVTVPSFGTAVIEIDGTITYTPTLNAKGVDSFGYTITDARGATDSATVVVTVGAENDPPVANDDSFGSDEGATLIVDAASGVLANDTDPDSGTVLSAVLVSDPVNGTLGFAADGSFTYVHDGSETTEDSFTYRASDGTLSSEPATVRFTVNPVNDTPVAGDDSATVVEDSFADIAVLANDSDMDLGDALSVFLVDDGANGATAINPDLTIRYSPQENFNGTDSFTYVIRDLSGATATATVNVTVDPSNDDPLARDDVAVTIEDTAIDVAVLGNDADVDGDPVSISAVGASADGSPVNMGTYVAFTPNGGFSGDTSFTYTIEDGNGGSATANVDVTVSVDPGTALPGDDTGTTTQEEVLVLDVLANDFANGLGPLILIDVAQPVGGTAFIIEAGDPIGRPDRQTLGFVGGAGFLGLATFSYTIADTDGNQVSANVRVQVNPRRNAPLALPDETATEQDRSVTLDPKANDFDPDGDSLTIDAVSNGISGTVVINGDNTVTYTPNPGFTGVDSFSYTVRDPGNLGDSELVTINVVTPGNLAPVFNDTLFVVEDQPVDINVLANDPGMVTLLSTTDPAHGTTSVNPDQTVHFIPEADYNGSDTFTYTVDVAKTGGATASVFLSIRPVRDPPRAVFVNVSTNEDTAIDVDVLSATSDPDDPGTTPRLVSVTPSIHGTTSINPDDSVHYLPDPGFTGTDLFSYTVVGNSSFPRSALVTVTVISVNDPPSFTAGADQTVFEDAGLQTVAAWATDLDDGDGMVQTLTFNVTGNTNPALFAAGPAIDGTSGDLTYTPADDAVGSATLTVELMDSGTGSNTSAPANFTITLDPVNDAPSFTVGADQTVLEDGGAQSVPAWATTISPGPVDESAQTVTFTITGNTNPALFTVAPAVSADGTLSFTPEADTEGSAVITLDLSDDGGTANGGVDTSAAQTFTITLSGVNDAPSFTVGADQTVLEDAGAQNTAAWATALNDGDGGGQTLTFNITGNTNPGLFAVGPAVDGTTGDLSYTTAADANGSATITLEIMDDGGTANGGVDTSAAQSFTVNVTPVNDAPGFTVGADQTVLEDAGAQSVPGWATAISPGPADESGQVVSFNVTGNTNPTLFSVAPAVAADGTLSFTPAAGMEGSATITLDLSDDGGTADGGVDTSAAQTFLITLSGVNDVPSFTVGADQTVLEDAGAQNSAAWATALNDGDGGGQTLTFNITGNSNPGLFAAAPAVDGTTGNLSYTPAADANGSATITLELMDDGGTANGGVDTSAAQSFTINVTPVNDAPGFTVGADQTVLEDAGAQSVPAWATAISPGPADESGQVVSFNVTGNTNPTLFSVAPAVAADGTLSFTPAAGMAGTATITLDLSDDGGTADGGVDTSAAQTFLITLSGVNDVPSFTVGADQTVLEDAGAQNTAAWATALNDGDGGGQTLTFNITGNTNPGLFAAAPAVDGTTGNLSYTPAADANGTATITLELMDDGGTANGGVDTSAAQSFTINVTAVNDAPTFTAGPDQTILEDAGAQKRRVAWASALSTGPADESGQSLSFNITGNTNPGLFAVAPTIDGTTGNLSYTAAADAVGSAAVTVTLSDDGGTANGGDDTSAAVTFNINVTGVNDEPSFSAGGNINFTGSATPQTEAAWATAVSAGPADESGQVLTFNVTGNTNPGLFAAGPAVNGTTGDLTYTPAGGANGTATITLALMDNGGTANGGDDTSPAIMFTISLTSLNMEPSFTAGADPTVLEDVGAQSVAAWATAIDDGDGSTQMLTFNVTGNTNPGLFAVAPAVNATSGNLTFTPAADASGSSMITVELMDDGGTAGGGDDTSPSASFTITVTAVNDMPSFTAGMDQTVLEDAGAQSVPTWATAISAGPADEAGQTVSFNITGNTNPGLFAAGPAVASNGTLTYTSAVNASGSATLTIEAQDDGGTANGGVDTSASTTFTITVTDVNDPPTVVADSSYEAYPHLTLAVDRAGPAHGHLVSTFQDVLDNDSDSDSMSIAVTTIVGSGDVTEPFVGATTLGGSVEMYADGSFLYFPPANVVNMADTFQYTVEDTEGNPANGTVTITIDNVNPIWFIDDTAGAGGDGTVSAPFNTVAGFNASAHAAGHTIFVHRGNTGVTPLDGVFTLLANQVLHGNGAVLQVTHPEDASTATIVSAGMPPVLTSSSGDVVTLGSDNTVQGLNINATNGAGILSGTVMKTGFIGLGVHKRAGTTTIDDVEVSIAGANHGLLVGTDSGTFNISNSSFAGMAGHTGAGMRLAGTTATFNLSSTTFADHGSAIELDASDSDVTLTNCTITQTSAGFANRAVATNMIAGGSFNLAGTSSVSVANLDGGSHALELDGNGNDLDMDFAATTTITIDASAGMEAIHLANLPAAATCTFQGTVTISGAGSHGVNLDTVSGTLDFDDLAISGAAGTGVLISGGGGTHTLTLNGASGLVNTAGRSVDVVNMTAGSFNLNGGLINDDALGVRIDNNALTAASGFANNLDIDTAAGTGLTISNNTGSQVALSGTVTVDATDQAGVDINTSDNVSISGATVTTLDGGGGGGLAVSISSMVSITATFNSVTAVNTGGSGISLLSNVGTTTFDDLSLNTAGTALLANNAGTVNVNTGGGNSPVVTATAGRAIDLNTVTTTGFNLANVVANTSATEGVVATACTGTFNFGNGTLTTSSEGVNLSSSGSGVFTFQDLDITAGSTAGIIATNAGTLNIDPDDNDSPTIAATNGPALDLDNTLLNTNFATLSSTSSTGVGIDLTNTPAASGFTVSGATTVTTPTGIGINIDDVEATASLSFNGTTVTNRPTHGVFVRDHDGAALNFGDVDIPNGLGSNGNAFHVQTSGGMATSSGPISLASLDASDTVVGTVRADGGSDGVPDNENDDGHGIKRIDHTGGFTITGVGTQADGGTIEDIEGDGISMIRSGGLNLNLVTINNIGTDNAVPATVDNACVFGIDISGSHHIQNSTFSRFQDGGAAGSNSRGIKIRNDSTNFTELRVTDTTFFNDNTLLGDDGILVETFGTTSGSIVVTSLQVVGHMDNRSEFHTLSGMGVQILQQNGNSGTITTNITNSTFRDTIAVGGFGGIDLSSTGTGIMNNTVDGCYFRNLFPGGVNNGGVITLFAAGTVDYSGTVNNCQIGDAGNVGSDGRGGVRAATSDLLTETPSDFDITITNNTIEDTDREAITVDVRGGAVPTAGGQTSDIIIMGNNIGQVVAAVSSGREGMEIRARDNAKIVNMLIQNNAVNNVANSSSDETIDIDAEDSASINLTFWGNTLTLDGSSTSNPNSLEIFTEDAGSSICLDLNGDNVGANSNSADDGILLTETAGAFTLEDVGGNTPKTFLEARNAAVVTVTGTLSDSGGDCPNP